MFKFSLQRPAFWGLFIALLFLLLNTCPVFAEPPAAQTYEQLLASIRQTRHATESRIEQAVRQEKLREAWETGKLIDEHILQHKERAEYGKEVVAKLAKDLEMNDDELYRMVEFVRAYPNFERARNLSWSHYMVLLTVNNLAERSKLEETAEKEQWTRDRLREEVKNLKAQRTPTETEAPPPKRETLPNTKPGKPNFYSIMKNLKTEKLVVDLGFETYLDLSQKTVFHEGEIVELIEEPETFPDQVPSQPVHTAQTTQLENRPEATREDLFTYKVDVLNVIDGDTIRAVIHLGFGVTQIQVLRLKGLDAPEIISAEGKEAKAFLEKELAKGPVIIRSIKSDKYDRYLADIFVNGEYINQKLVEKEFAVTV